jgi:nicotinamide riboside kinase
MRIAIIGSFGTGKTTIIEKLKKELKEHKTFEDIFRKICHTYNYTRPRDIVHQSGVTALIGVALGTFLETRNEKNIIFDQCPLSTYAYLEEHQKQHNHFYKKIIDDFSKGIDAFIYCPTNQIPLVSDEMRPTDKELQIRIDSRIQKLLKEFKIPKEKIHIIKEKEVTNRIQEIKHHLEVQQCQS